MSALCVPSGGREWALQTHSALCRGRIHSVLSTAKSLFTNTRRKQAHIWFFWTERRRKVSRFEGYKIYIYYYYFLPASLSGVPVCIESRLGCLSACHASSPCLLHSMVLNTERHVSGPFSWDVAENKRT